MKAIRRLTESSCEDCAALYKTDDTPAQKVYCFLSHYLYFYFRILKLF